MKTPIEPILEEIEKWNGNLKKERGIGIGSTDLERHAETILAQATALLSSHAVIDKEVADAILTEDMHCDWTLAMFVLKAETDRIAPK